MNIFIRQFSRLFGHSFLRLPLYIALLAGGLMQATQTKAEGRLEEEVYCLALNIYHEARGEPTLGATAIGLQPLTRYAWNAAAYPLAKLDGLPSLRRVRARLGRDDIGRGIAAAIGMGLLA